MSLRSLRIDESIPKWCKRHGVTLELRCEAEDTDPKGNASAIDEATDAEILANIYEQQEAGNEWAWCCAHVTATHDASGITGDAYLGGRSFDSRSDFERSGMLEEMQREAISDLHRLVNAMHRAICTESTDATNTKG